MYLYLVQHGKAMPKEENPDRPLTSEGYKDVRKIASFLAMCPDVKISAIVHSGKTRAEQTAEVFAGALHLKGKVRAEKELNPESLPWGWVERLAKLEEDLMIVGHLPHLQRLSSLLICQDENKPCVEFRNGGVVCLKRNESGIWSLQWIIVPQIILAFKE